MQPDLDAALTEAMEAEETARRAWAAELDRIEGTPLVVGDLGRLARELADPGYQAKWRAYTEAAQARHAILDRMKAAALAGPSRPIYDPAHLSREVGHA